jgi:hypothetical protein
MESSMKMCLVIKSLFGTIITVLLLHSNLGIAQNSCSAYSKTDQQLGSPLLWGDPYNVPELKLRFIDGSGKPRIPKSIDVHYYWQWLAYPYPEHSWGAWENAEEWVQCTTGGGQNDLRVPAITIKPRGWYEGKYTRFPWNKKPKFDRLEIVIEYDGHTPRLVIAKSELKKYRDALAIVKLEKGLAEVVFSK